MRLSKTITLCLLATLLCLWANLSAKSDRYFTKQFESPEIRTIENLFYGQKLNQGGELSDLLVDLFLPPDVSEGGKYRDILNGNRTRFEGWNDDTDMFISNHLSHFLSKTKGPSQNNF